VTESDTIGAPVYAGSRGLVVDTRALLRRGYRPTTVQIAFPDYARLDTELPVDPMTNLAIFVVENDSLTDAESLAFDRGTIRTNIVVLGEDPGAGGTPAAVGPATASHDEVELATSDAPRTLDASNRPASIDNDTLVTRLPPLSLSPSTPYLFVADGRDDVVTRTGTNCKNCFLNEMFSLAIDPADTVWGAPRRRQDFYFRAETDSTYTILSFSEPTLGAYLRPAASGASTIVTTTDTVASAGEFLIVQESDARVTIKDMASQLFLQEPDASTSRWTLGAQAARFRLLAPRAELTIQNLGTSFNQPIIPPARVAFAVQTTIRNCSAATVEDVIGRTETRSITRSFATSESFQIVSDTSHSYGYTNSGNLQLKYEPSDVTGGLSGELNHSWGRNVDGEYSTSQMRDTTRVTQADTTETVEITRERGIIVPPFSAVQVSDLVRTNSSPIVVPWTQTLRIQGEDRSSGDALTGGELVSLLGFNLVGAIPVQTSQAFVDITLRGSTTADHFYKTETTAVELTNACSGTR
jgi:hypothetical protein